MNLGFCKARKPILVSAFVVAALLAFNVQGAIAQEGWTIAGCVLDASTGMPLEGAIVRLVGWRWNRGRFDIVLRTDSSGYYNANLRWGYYWVLAYADDPETAGMDFVPGIMELDLRDRESSLAEDRIAANFELVPGASVILTGLPEFVEVGGVPEGIQYGTYVVESRYSSLLRSRSLVSFSPQVWAVLGLEYGHIIAASDSELYPIVRSSYGNIVVDNEGFPFRFQQGSKTVLDISKAVMERNVAFVRDRLTSTWLMANELSVNGIDVGPEFDDLDTAFDLLDSARSELQEGMYSQCFIDLRAAHIIREDVQQKTLAIRADTTFSPIPLSFLLVLCGFGLASVFVENNALRICVGALIGSIFLGFYYYISPGWRLTEPTALFASCAAAASVAVGLALLLPAIKRDVVTQSGVALASNLTSTFSLATRNLKRRRMRSLLVLASILTLVFGFTVFTSFQIKSAVGSGRPSSSYPRGKPPVGLMVVPPPGPSEASGLPSSMVEGLRADPLVASVAPKTESSPDYMEAQIISESGENITIRGVIGFSADEVKMNAIDASIVEGHYMEEAEKAILISARAAERIRVKPGDKVRLSWVTGSGVPATESFMVAGIFDDLIFEQFVDLDGQPIRPYTLMNHERAYMSADSVVVLNWQELLRLGLGKLTRINVQARSAEDVSDLAVQLVGKWRYFVYASDGKEIKLFYYRRDPTLSGGSAIPMLLAMVGLNVLACTLNAVYERRKEIATLSLVGLNPSQISYIFIAEAGLVAFIGGVVGYLLGIGGPRLLLSLGGPGFLTEKVSWTWSVAVILMAMFVSVAASVLPAIKASTIATPKLPLKWKLDYLPAAKDTWLLHIPQLISYIELRHFVRFVQGQFEELQRLRTIPEKMEMIDMVEESDHEKEVRKLIFAHSFAQEGSRAFRTENELIATRSKGLSTYSLDLAIRITMIYNYEPMEVVKKTASAIRRLMLKWTATPSSERWGEQAELVQVDNLSVASEGKALVRGVSFDVMRGEIMGVAGEGRRALILAVAGMIKPSGGAVFMRGIDTYSRREEVRKSIGLLLKGAEPYEYLTPRENLKFLAKLEGKSDVNKLVEDIMERCGIKQRADEKTSSLKRGDRRRLAIAQAIINKPQLLLLEDPLADLDVDEANGVVALLNYLSRFEGVTAICTGRNEDELRFCNRILFLDKGSEIAIVKRREG
ncbi:MAG: ATP-binding cassette domain-containing protein [Candidatus Brockarchaeota archaeon]|nr:ATP-binding cassette domain-containing protein [Candidatus Brockarchaeota archaeon]